MRLFVASWLRKSAYGICAAAFLFPIGLTHAAENVGVAVTVRNDVTGKIQSQTVKVDNGSNVFGREIVRTGPDSSAKVVLKDNTNLNVGPNSSVTLDNFVFQGDSDYKQAGFNLAKGAFRFTSGGSDKRAYDLKTPAATIGVRGTDFVVIVKDRRSHIEVKEGQTVICPLKASASQATVPIASEKKRCRKSDGQNDDLARDDHNRRRENECCHKGCAEVNQGEAVDVTETCVTPSEFTNVNVGEGQMSYAAASGMGAGGLSMGTAAAAAAAAGAAGAIAGSNNNQPPPQTPFIPPQQEKPKPPSGE